MIKDYGCRRRILKSYNLPVGAHIAVNDGEKSDQVMFLLKYPELLENLVTSPVVCPGLLNFLKPEILPTHLLFLKSTVKFHLENKKR
jgi:hypothetical protein